MDANGDTQGNYTLIGLQPYDVKQEYGLYPVGVFHIPENHTTIPVRINQLLIDILCFRNASNEQ